MLSGQEVQKVGTAGIYRNGFISKNWVYIETGLYRKIGFISKRVYIEPGFYLNGFSAK